MPENPKLANAAITARDASAMLLRSMRVINEEQKLDAKAENDALRDDVAAGRRRLYQSSLVSRVKLPYRLRRG